MLKLRLDNQSSLKLFLVQDIIYGSGIPYEGDYEVIPQIKQEVVLDTKKKTLSEDIVVHEVPLFEVTNESGGLTMILGGRHG